MTRPTPPRLAALVAVLALASCGTPGPQKGAAPVDAGDARTLAETGDHAGAARAYERLAGAHRENKDALLLDAATQWRIAGDLKAANKDVGALKRKKLPPEEAVRLDLLLAELALDRGDAARALDLSTLPEDHLEPADLERLYRLRAAALAATGRPIESAQARARLQPMLPPDQRAADEQGLLKDLAAVETSTLQRALTDLPRGEAVRPWIERALRARGVAPVRVVARATREAGALLPGETQREGFSANGRVALLLPMSGSIANAGRAIRDGFMSAYFTERGAKADVALYDPGDSIEGALAAYKRATKDGATRIVGPVSREQVGAVYDKSGLAVPVLALNFPDSGLPPPRGNQQFGLLPDEEAAVAADHAREKGYNRVAVLAAREDWAERAALAFRAQFEHAGGLVAGEGRVGGEVVDLSKSIDDALGNGGADAVFLAVRPAQGRLLVPQLRARGFPDLPILATSHVYSGNPNRGLDRDLDGVEFCDAPWMYGLAAGLPERTELARNLATADNAPRLFAFGIDAFRLLPYLEWLEKNPEAYVAGAAGQLSIDDFGRVHRGLAWLRFDGGVARSADTMMRQPGD